MATPLGVRPTAGTREAEALDLIIDRQIAGEHLGETGVAHGLVPPVSRARARQLLDRLEERGAIVRRPGRQRSIVVPDLPRARILQELQRDGWVVNPDTRTLEMPGCPKGQLPVLPELEHIPDDFEAGIDQDDHHHG